MASRGYQNTFSAVDSSVDAAYAPALWARRVQADDARRVAQCLGPRRQAAGGPGGGSVSDGH